MIHCSMPTFVPSLFEMQILIDNVFLLPTYFAYFHAMDARVCTLYVLRIARLLASRYCVIVLNGFKTRLQILWQFSLNYLSPLSTSSVRTGIINEQHFPLGFIFKRDSTRSYVYRKLLKIENQYCFNPLNMKVMLKTIAKVKPIWKILLPILFFEFLPLIVSP